MPTITIHVRGSRTAVRQALMQLPTITRSGGPIANTMLKQAGTEALKKIKAAFLIKMAGGTDEAGERWQPLSPRTIAYRRVRRTKAERGRASTPSQALTKKQQNRWWDLYRQGLGIFKGDKASAARRAWSILKREGATTLLAKYGGRQVPILKDTGILLNSLSPSSSSFNRIFLVANGQVIFGTKVKYAAYHHVGVPNRLPQRRLWPSPDRWPSSWWRAILEPVKQGIVDLAIQIIRQVR